MFINYAHRGASSYYPENTLSAFCAGVDMGANGIETDVQRTKDGVLVLFHDDTIDRITEGKGRISDYTYKELLELHVRNDDFYRIDKIISLEDFLRFFSWRDLTFAIEIKQKGIEAETMEMLDSYNMVHKTVVTSSFYDSLVLAKHLRPSYRTGFIAEIPIDDELLTKMKEDGIEELCPEAYTLTAEKMRTYWDWGFDVRAWGIYTPEMMKTAYNLGVCGMTVNFPDVLAKFLLKKQEIVSERMPR